MKSKNIGKTALIFLFILLASCSKQSEQAQENSGFSIAVFIPGVVSGSPTYEMLAEGAEKAVEESENAELKIIEGGYNQGEWLDKLTVLASTGEYDLIVSTNPAIPELCSQISVKFPEQKFFVLDGYLEGNKSIYTFRYNQTEQAFLNGYFAGLVTTSSMEGANGDLKVGLVAGQEYPDMMQSILPGFSEGAARVNPDIKTDFRVVGNWYDAEKARELAESMYNAGADVILTIAGGANQGVITAAKNMGRYVLMYDVSSYDMAPGTIIGSTRIMQEKAAYEKIKSAIKGEMPFGKADIGTVGGGWITFDNKHPLYLKNVPEGLQEQQEAVLKDIEADRIDLPMNIK